MQAKPGDIPILDSYVVDVYNRNALDILVNAVDGKNEPGKTDADEVTLDNHDKIESLVDETGKTISLKDQKMSVMEFAKDINLVSMISINYGEHVWGWISDQIKWDVAAVTENEEIIKTTATTLNYAQGGAYSDINSYNYVSYSPSDTFMAVGKENGKTVITATHARTGMKSNITVTSNTLKNQLYLFKFLPEQKTKVQYVTYIDGKEKERTVWSDENGELALYEENGIQSNVQLFSTRDSGSYNPDYYVGTMYYGDIRSGEQDISKLQNYPVNNYRLGSLSKTRIYVTDENGIPYAFKQLWVRGGVYKNDKYCYAAKLGASIDDLKDGKQDQIFKTDMAGAITVYFDPTQFYTEDDIIEEDKTEDGEISKEGRIECKIEPTDSIDYDFEKKFQPNDQVDKVEKAYEPQMVHITTGLNDARTFIDDCDAQIQARVVKNGANTPIINSLVYIQADENENIGNISNIYGYKGAIGLSSRYPNAQIKTESLMWGEEVETGELIFKQRDGKEISYGRIALEIDANKYKLKYADEFGKEFQNQEGIEHNEVITYAFADMPVVESVWELK